jgi:hypothetical protein
LTPTERPALAAPLRTLRLAPAYVAVVASVRVAMCALAGEGTRTDLVHAASTNVVNLAHGRVGTLVLSAFVLEGRGCLPALLALGVALGLAELAWGGLVLAGVFLYGHLVATLLVFAGLAAGLSLHRLCRAVASAADVGPSYGAVTVVGALLATSALPHARRWQAAAAAAALGAVLLDRTFTDAGHAVALLLGFAIGGRLEGVRGARGPTAAAAG